MDLACTYHTHSLSVHTALVSPAGIEPLVGASLVSTLVVAALVVTATIIVYKKNKEVFYNMDKHLSLIFWK